MTRASAGPDPTMNNAGPAVESQADGSGFATTVLSGGGTIATVVSFFAAAGVLDSHPSVRASIRAYVESLITRGMGRGSRCIRRNLHGLLVPSIEADNVRVTTSPDVFGRFGRPCTIVVYAPVILHEEFAWCPIQPTMLL
jgi:hypothetical protein